MIQKHAARRLHFDFRLELDGVLKSWAVPKGPPLDPGVKALAVHVEDHPLEYGGFEGVIPQGEYGGGTVMLWDRGQWEPQGDPQKGYEKGHLKFRLRGKRLRGSFRLVRMHGDEDSRDNWLLMKSDDDAARPGETIDALPSSDRSVLTGRTMAQIASDADRPWTSDRSETASENSAPEEPQRIDPAALPGARRSDWPERIAPELATLAARPPQGEEWVHELKFDGYRVIAAKRDGQVKLWTRRGNDWTEKFPSVAEAVGELPCAEAILDGEVVVLAKDGTSDFQALQNSLTGGRAAEHRYFVFDLPYFEGFDLSRCGLRERKALLERVIPPGEDAIIRYSDHMQGQGPEFLRNTCRYKLEGVVSKRLDSPYRQRRTKDWIKVKCLKRQEFVVGGYTEPSGGRSDFGSLLLGYHQDGSGLVYCGRVGTGFTKRSLEEIGRRLRERETDEPPFAHLPEGIRFRDVHWCKADLVAEVEFSQWTDEGLLRHPSFQGLRLDKPAGEVVREVPRGGAMSEQPEAKSTEAERTTGKKPASTDRVAGVRLSHPGRVLFPEMGVTKQELAEYYASIADWILPHVVDRPLSVVRCPQGRHKDCFYQKHVVRGTPDAVRGVEIEEKGKSAQYLVIDDLAGLISLVQLGSLEFHPWGARTDRLERPDRIVFDLDPGENVPWSVTVEAARTLRDRLTRLDLVSFVRLSGGKGLHLVVPIDRRSNWEEVKTFARDIAHGLERFDRDRFIATASKAHRRGKIYVDYLRNGRGATAVASYSTRAHAGAPVATPLRWDELGGDVPADAYDVQTLPRRLQALQQDPWQGFFETRQVLTRSRRQAAKE